MMSGVKTILALIKGKAVIITQRADDKADVRIGKGLSKQFVISSLAGTVKYLTL